MYVNSLHLSLLAAKVETSHEHFLCTLSMCKIWVISWACARLHISMCMHLVERVHASSWACAYASSWACALLQVRMCTLLKGMLNFLLASRLVVSCPHLWLEPSWGFTWVSFFSRLCYCVFSCSFHLFVFHLRFTNAHLSFFVHMYFLKWNPVAIASDILY